MSSCYAKMAAEYIGAWCREVFEKDPETMETHMANGSMIDCFDHKGYGSHKYIPADLLTNQLGMPRGAGVYGYWKMGDDSYLLLTCGGRLAYWSGKLDEKAEWPVNRKEKV